MNVFINGIECKLYYEERIPKEQAPLGYPNMYHLRHDEDDWTCPIHIEQYVAVNFFGTVFMEEPIEFGEQKYIEINQFKMKDNYVKIKLKKELLNTIFFPSNKR
jgi:hypothetical protein